MLSQTPFDRRAFMSWVAGGLGGAALASLMLQDRLLQAAGTAGEASDPPPPRTGRRVRAARDPHLRLRRL